MKKFKRWLSSAVVLIFISGSAYALESSFDSGDENWRPGNDVTLSWQETGGNPGGFLQGVDWADGRIWYFVSPESWSGDWSSCDRLSFDLKVITAGGIKVFGPMLIIKGNGGGELVWSGNAPTRSWTNYSISLVPSTFGVSQADFDSVMGDAKEFWIEGEYISGLDTEGLDNVELHYPPMKVELYSFKATAEQGGIRLTWTTGTEESAGFRVWRANIEDGNDEFTITMLEELAPGDTDELTAIGLDRDSQLISAKGNSREGADYSYIDLSANEAGVTYYYLLEDVESDGNNKLYWNFIDSATMD
jgi:hypothetical protein